MFSLSSLVAQASNDEPTTNRKNPRGDDSGLIDLKALAAEAERQPAAPVLAPVFPFGSPEPAPAPAVETRVEPAPVKSRKGPWLFAAVGAVLVSAVAIGAASARPTAEAMTLGGRMSPHFVAALQRAATPPPSIEPKEPTAPEKTDATTDKKTAPKTSPVVRQTRPIEPKKTEPPKKEPPKLDPNCDLMCQMRKATQK